MAAACCATAVLVSCVARAAAAVRTGLFRSYHLGALAECLRVLDLDLRVDYAPSTVSSCLRQTLASGAQSGCGRYPVRLERRRLPDHARQAAGTGRGNCGIASCDDDGLRAWRPEHGRSSAGRCDSNPVASTRAVDSWGGRPSTAPRSGCAARRPLRRRARAAGHAPRVTPPVPPRRAARRSAGTASPSAGGRSRRRTRAAWRSACRR